MTFTARYAGKCADCGELFPAGTPLQRHHVTGAYSHEVCEPPEQPRREVCPGYWLERSTMCTACTSYWGSGPARHCGTSECQAEEEKL